MHRYRVMYHPKSKSGMPVSNSGGREWSVEVDAASRDAAEKAAAALIGHPHIVIETQRLDDVAVAKPKRLPRARPKLESLGLITAAELLKRSSK